MKQDNVSHDIKNVKIVLGNGFDLFCGLKTSYKDYFSSPFTRYDRLDKWIDGQAAMYESNPESANEDPRGLAPIPKDIGRINCWDLYFTMTFDETKSYFWCDVETEMLNSLIKRDADVTNDYKPHWENVWEYINKEKTGSHKPRSIILGQFLVVKAGGIPKTKEDFYEFLLKQLREFENNFARFIAYQHVEWNGMFTRFNEAYIRNARMLLEQLCNPSEIASIGCFNYGFTPEAEFYEKCKFVNGNFLNPIFGIDSVFDPSDPRYIFTKTNRRIEWTMRGGESPAAGEFDNVVAFGHSLNSHDYNYFFPILDKLEMSDFSSNKKLIIAYSIYDETESANIKKRIRHALYSLFSAYADYCGKKDPTRLLDSLTTQGRVLTFEVANTSTKCEDFLEGVDPWSSDYSESDIAGRWEKYVEFGKTFVR